MCCHTCRPYLRDRLPVSFGAVFADEFEPMTGPSVGSLPVMDADIVREIGFRPVPIPQPRKNLSRVLFLLLRPETGPFLLRNGWSTSH
jgi:hypothetical protein